ncbi:MAG: tRNA (5-methylaminomethyl-2-thiouridine)(34)-methyltransferase MnmD [Candidatus Omnitrophica bacterium]|nr:tRNA (5-methylaminomethyl-2-thiouridine)(34)-methyltransferase MnmD [Candidatus Omnitrophota bacterium]
MENLEAQEVLLRWGDHGTPKSAIFDDKYFCEDQGYEEAVYVCCEGNSLQKRFSGLDPQKKGTFTVLETGFGTGLDFCCAWQVWDEYAPVSWKLHFISVELYPLSSEQVGRALGLWPALSGYKDSLVSQYQFSIHDIKNFYFNDQRVCLTIAFDHVVLALSKIKEKRLAPQGADALFLDGFAPSKNPEMWSPEVFKAMAALSHEGTTLSTFTVAGNVRRGLEAAGFTVQRVPGHGKKQHILTGFFNPQGLAVQ